MESRAHLTRVLAIWVVLSVVCDLLIGFVLVSHMPPGYFSNTASDQIKINNILALVLTPININVVTFFIYAIVSFRQPTNANGG